MTTVTRMITESGDRVASAMRFFHRDHLGAVGAVTDAGGLIPSRVSNDPWGRPELVAGVNQNLEGLSGLSLENTVGLLLSFYRPYDFTLGRWLSEDPAQWSGGNNFYGYADNRPTTLSDPLGVAPCQPSPKMLECLKEFFKKPVDDVKIETKKPPKVFFRSRQAETRRGKITIYIPCEDFLGRPDLVLEEYYHVVEQWNTGRLIRRKYLWESMKHGYEKNKYELEAWDFVNKNLEEFKRCLCE